MILKIQERNSFKIALNSKNEITYDLKVFIFLVIIALFLRLFLYLNSFFNFLILRWSFWLFLNEKAFLFILGNFCLFLSTFNFFWFFNYLWLNFLWFFNNLWFDFFWLLSSGLLILGHTVLSSLLLSLKLIKHSHFFLIWIWCLFLLLNCGCSWCFLRLTSWNLWQLQTFF